MNRVYIKSVIFICVLIFLAMLSETGISSFADDDKSTGGIKLPSPGMTGAKSLEACISGRRSVREYQEKPISMEQLSQLLWAAQGITSDKNQRSIPSAGGLYPLEIFIVATDVENLPPGLYRYMPKSHWLKKICSGNFRDSLSKAALGQKCVADAPATIIIAAEYMRTQKKYGDRAERYILMEVGCACQNIYLQCEALGLGTVAVGAFYDDKVKEVILEDYSPLLLMPIGLKSQ